MSSHPTAAQLEAFRQRTLPSPSLIEVSRHICDCDECRRQMESRLPAPASDESLRETFLLKHVHHLEYAELQTAVDGTTKLDESQELHLKACAMCRREHDDLRQFAASLGDGHRDAHRWGRIALYTATSAAALLFTFVVLERHHAASTRPVLTAQLNDAGSRIGLDSAGRLQVPGNLSDEDRQLIKQAIQTHRLDTPSITASSEGPQEVFRGGRSASPAFFILSPQNENFDTPLPTFRWQPLTGALSYRVSVYNHAYHRVAQSPPLTTVEWTPATPLQRGSSYTWSVEASVPGDRVQATAQTGSDARFQILSESADAHIEAAEQQNPNAHLLLAALLALAGARSEAHAQLEQLQAENPGSSLVRDLDSSLTRVRPMHSEAKPDQPKKL